MRECEQGGEKKPNGNCTIPDPTDQLPVQCVGIWAKEKHHYLRRYIEATKGVRHKYLTPGPKRPAGGGAFIDLFAGPGKCRLRENGEIISGSPLVALEHDGAPFTKVIACDLDDENVTALRARTVRWRDRVQIFHGNCNDVIDSILEQIPVHGLNIALLDPFAVDQLSFETIEKLAQFKRMDLIIHYPTMDLKRNVGRNQEKVNRFLGSDDETSQIASPSDVVKKIATLRTTLAALGYTGEQVRSMPVKNTMQNVLYHLVFVSKHEKGDTIWNSILKTNSQGQGSLF